MLKKIPFSIILFVFLLAFTVHALDIVAPLSERKFGVVMVKGTNPSKDKVTLTNVEGEKRALKEGKDIKVPIGDYSITVVMQEYTFTQAISVQPTERTDVIVTGYGNLKVNGPKGSVEAYKAGSDQPVAKFSMNEVKTVPTGDYEVKIFVGGTSVTQNTSVVTNTTRQIDVKF